MYAALQLCLVMPPGITNATALRFASTNVTHALYLQTQGALAKTAARKQSLVGTARCFAANRPHVRTNEETIDFRSDGVAIWRGFGQRQIYRYKYANGILTESGAMLPGPLRSQVTWTGPQLFKLTPLGPEQVAQSCRLSYA
jgi:hypothetical protein